MPRLNLQHVSLYYETHGDGPPLLLIHGLGSSTHDWEAQVQAFSAARRVITFDLRGHGQSDRPPGPYSMPLFAADTAELLDRLGIAAADVVGLSLGGCIALQLALDHPARVRSLVLANTSPEFIRRSIRARLEIWRRTFMVHWRGLRPVGERVSRRLLPGPEHAARRADFVARFARNSPHAYLASIRAVVGWSVKDRLAAIRCPALVVASEHDYTPVAAQRRFMENMPGARLAVLPGAHHAAPVECPAAFNAAIAEFLAALAPRA